MKARRRSILRGRKYGNIPVEYDGQRYDSKAEARYASGLDQMKRLGLVQSWQRQVTFKLVVNDVLVTTYRADFVIAYPDGRREVHDVKGHPDRRWPMVKKLMLACWGIVVREVR